MSFSVILKTLDSADNICKFMQIALLLFQWTIYLSKDYHYICTYICIGYPIALCIDALVSFATLSRKSEESE